MNVCWKVDRKGSFRNTWNVKSFLLSKWLLESAAATVVGCTSSNLYNFNLALRPSFHASVYFVVKSGLSLRFILAGYNSCGSMFLIVLFYYKSMQGSCLLVAWGKPYAPAPYSDSTVNRLHHINFHPLTVRFELL